MSMSAAERVDYLIIGAGIAGASIAYWLARTAACCCWSASRSRATTAPAVRPRSTWKATAAAGACADLRQRAFFDHPPEGLRRTSLLTPRGALFYAGAALRELDAHEALVRSVSDKVQRLDREQTLAMVPVLRGKT
jgi:D-arginine dehydrogenase